MLLADRLTGSDFGWMLVVWLGLWLPLGIPLARWAQWQPGRQPVKPAAKVPLVLSLYAIAPIAVALVAPYRGHTWMEWLTQAGAWGMPAGATWRMVAQGWGAGAAGLALLTRLRLSGGGWQAEARSPRDWLGLAAIAPIALIVSGVEEVWFRGWLPMVLSSLGDGFLGGGFLGDGFLGGGVGAIALAAGIFAIAHLLWDGPGGSPQLGGLWLMGMVLSVARWAAGGSLGWAWGLHAGWIWAIATLDTLFVWQVDPDRSHPGWMGQPDLPLTGILPLLLLVLTGAVLGAIGIATAAHPITHLQ
jgi:hypothetical protein